MKVYNEETYLSQFGEILNDQTFADEGITKVFKFNNFVDAFAFMTKVAFLAEKHDHHPDWSNVYNTVNIRLNTHSAGGLTIKDIDLAKEIDLIQKQLNRSVYA